MAATHSLRGPATASPLCKYNGPGPSSPAHWPTSRVHRFFCFVLFWKQTTISANRKRQGIITKAKLTRVSQIRTASRSYKEFDDCHPSHSLFPPSFPAGKPTVVFVLCFFSRLDLPVLCISFNLLSFHNFTTCLGASYFTFTTFHFVVSTCSPLNSSSLSSSPSPLFEGLWPLVPMAHISTGARSLRKAAE